MWWWRKNPGVSRSASSLNFVISSAQLYSRQGFPRRSRSKVALLGYGVT